MNKKKYLILFLSIFSNFIFSKKNFNNTKKVKNRSIEDFKDKNWLNASAWFKIIPLSEILKNNPLIIYKKVIDQIFFDIPPFNISPMFPHKGYFKDLFILEIPRGRVQGKQGYVFIDEKLPEEMVRADYFETLIGIPKISNNKIQKIEGRVIVIAQYGYHNYYHWIFEVLGRLAMLEMAKIEYDYIYVEQSNKFMQETFELWGIDSSKIIIPTDDDFCIEADQLIVPSMVINTSCYHKHAGNFQHPITSNYVRNKLLEAALKKNIDTSEFSKRVFISRKDSYNSRRILNEDQIFNNLELLAFKKYEISKLSVAQQIILFNQAEIIVGEHGAGLTNCLFCKPNTKVIEIFQALIANDYWWLSGMFNLQYVPIKTLPIDVNYFANWRDRTFETYYKNALCLIQLPNEKIKEVLSLIENNT